MRLCIALGLDVDPVLTAQQPARRAIEVYPHPALVSLFDLDYSLKYKAKSGRSVEQRHAAFKKLVAHLESLRSAEPKLDVTGDRWFALRDVVASSSSGAELDRAEDEIDAYVCAYIALYYSTHGLEKCRVVGTRDAGYIVTALGPDHARKPDQMTAANVSATVARK